MLSAIKWQLKLMINRLNFKIAFTIMMIIAVASPVFFAANGWLLELEKSTTVDKTYAFILWDEYPMSSMLSYLLPIISILPFSVIHFTNRQLNSTSVYMTRLGVKKYYISQAISSFIGSFIIVFLPLIINITLNNIFFIETKTDYFDRKFFNMIENDVPKQHLNYTDHPYAIPFAKFFFSNPIIYTIITALLLSLFIGLCGLLAYSISFKVKKYGIITAAPMAIVFYVGLKNKAYWGSTIPTKRFVNYNVLDYFVINGAPGRNYLMLFLFGLSILCISIVLIYLKIQSEQFD